MAFDLWARAQAKWRGILVYAVLQGAARFLTQYARFYVEHAGVKLFVTLATLAISIYCFSQTWLLLTKDRDGDEGWPPVF